MMFMRFAGEMVRHYGAQVTNDRSAPVTSLTQSLVELIVLIIGLLVLLNAMNVQVTPILTALGVGGLAVALALQDTLSNLFAGFYISVSGQMRLGDYIKLNSGEEGYLSDIGWRSTCWPSAPARTTCIIVPNAKAGAGHRNQLQPAGTAHGIVHPDHGGHGARPRPHRETPCLRKRRRPPPKCPAWRATNPPANLEPTGDWSLVFTVGFSVTEFAKQASVRHELRKRIIKRFRAEGIEGFLTRCAPFTCTRATGRPSARPRRATHVLLRIRRHPRAMASHRRPEIHPSQPDPVRALDEFLARLPTVFDDHHHAGIEILLGVIDIGLRGPCAAITSLIDFGAIGPVDPVSVRVRPRDREIPQDEEVRHLARSDHPHQIEVEIRPSGRGHVVIVVVAERAIEVVLLTTPPPMSEASYGRWKGKGTTACRPVAQWVGPI